jgi:signal transduction histidine kinase/ligand-binding sensor domain-containing protein
MLPLLARALVCLGLTLAPGLQAQVLGDFPVRRYGTDQGLSSEVVAAMVQDHEGRLWVGTEGGLSYFDGRGFSPYSGALPPGFVLSLAVDREGAIWVATDGGLARIKQGKTRIIAEADGIPRGPVQEVVEDAQGRLLVLSSGSIRVQKDLHTFVAPAPWPGQEPPTHLFADPSMPGAWATTDRTIWFWQNQAWTPLDMPSLASGEVLLGIAVDGARDLWLRTSSSLWRQPAEGPRTWIRARMAGGYSHISKLSRDAEGWIWVDTAAGLWRVRGDRREQFGHAQDDARGGIVDQEGGFWFRTDKGVLRVLGQTRWHAYGSREGLPTDTTWQMILDHQGRLWVGTDAGLWVEQERRFKRILSGRILNLALGKDNLLWASGSPGGTVHAVNTRTLTDQLIRIESLTVGRNTAGLTVDAVGLPWVADEQGHVVRGRPEGAGWTWETMPMEGPPPRDVQLLLPLPGDGILMLYGQSASLWRMGKWQGVPDVLPELPYIAATDPAGDVVIGYRTRPVLTFHRQQGGNLVRTRELDFTETGRNLVLYSVGLEPKGRIWVGTVRGLGYVEEGASRLRILGSEDRIVSPECNQSALLVEPGHVWIGTPSGLMSHDSQLPASAQALRPPLILSARVASRDLEFNGPLPELPRENNELEVRFMVPNYQAQDALSYEAKLSGVDSSWIRLDTPYLRYAGLPAGQHVLELRGVTQHGLLGPVTSIRFQVRPAWWERGWVRVLGFLGLAGVVVLLVKVREAQLERHNRDLIDEVARQTSALVAASKAKSAFLANMSHELRTPLNAILLYSEILQEDMRDPALVGLRSDAGKIHGAGRHLLGLIDDILDVSKIEAGRLRLELREIELHTFFKDLDATVRPLVEKNKNVFAMEVLKVPDHIYSDPTRFRQILVNLLSNSAKFTRNGLVHLKAWPEGEHLAVMVQDSGIGMTPEQQAKVFEEFEQADESTTRKFGGTGLGLTLVKKFTAMLGGELTLRSTPGTGTTFTLMIPVAGPPDGSALGARESEQLSPPPLS